MIAEDLNPTFEKIKVYPRDGSALKSMGFLPKFVEDGEPFGSNEVTAVLETVLGVKFKRNVLGGARVSPRQLNTDDVGYSEGLLFSVFLANSFLHQNDYGNYGDFIREHWERIYDDEYMEGIFNRGEFSDLVATSMLNSSRIGKVYIVLKADTSEAKLESFGLVSREVMLTMMNHGFAMSNRVNRPENELASWSAYPLIAKNLIEHPFSYDEFNSESVGLVIDATSHYNLEFWEMDYLSNAISTFINHTFMKSFVVDEIFHSYLGSFASIFRKHIQNISFSELISSIIIVTEIGSIVKEASALISPALFEGLHKISEDVESFQRFAAFCKDAIEFQPFKDIEVSFADFVAEFYSEAPFSLSSRLWVNLVDSTDRAEMPNSYLPVWSARRSLEDFQLSKSPR